MHRLIRLNELVTFLVTEILSILLISMGSEGS